MSISALAPGIARRLDIPNLDFKASFAGGPADAWFQAVIPALQVYFHRPNNTIIDSALPRFPDPKGEEGRRYLALHKKVERNATIVKHLKATSTDRDSLGFIFCRICRAAPGAKFGVEVIEAHHVLPVSEAGIRVVKASDFILICPNCHSSIHAGARVEFTPHNSSQESARPC
jgi:predicted HNH restriction endonuclease